MFLRFLYHTPLGRLLLRPLASRPVSQIIGRFMDHPASRFLITPFLDGNHICREDYLPETYQCFNDCFTRRIRPELRPVDEREDALIAPSDGYLRAYPITKDLVLPVKESHYTISGLLQDDELAATYEGGVCLVFRLCVNHYHRYCFPDDGRLVRKYFIPGALHTVQPVALAARPVFTENCREVSILDTKHFGRLAQIEVGAMLVGRIRNHDVTTFTKGQEKGCFDYGGSTIILLVPHQQLRFPSMLFDHSNRNQELAVKQGQRIAKKRH